METDQAAFPVVLRILSSSDSEVLRRSFVLRSGLVVLALPAGVTKIEALACGFDPQQLAAPRPWTTPTPTPKRSTSAKRSASARRRPPPGEAHAELLQPGLRWRLRVVLGGAGEAKSSTAADVRLSDELEQRRVAQVRMRGGYKMLNFLG